MTKNMDRKDKAQVKDISKKIKQGIRDDKRSETYEKYKIFTNQKMKNGRKQRDKKSEFSSRI